jgi:hypothetical protein
MESCLPCIKKLWEAVLPAKAWEKKENQKTRDLIALHGK